MRVDWRPNPFNDFLALSKNWVFQSLRMLPSPLILNVANLSTQVWLAESQYIKEILKRVTFYTTKCHSHTTSFPGAIFPFVKDSLIQHSQNSGRLCSWSSSYLSSVSHHLCSMFHLERAACVRFKCGWAGRGVNWKASSRNSQLLSGID